MNRPLHTTFRCAVLRPLSHGVQALLVCLAMLMVVSGCELNPKNPTNGDKEDPEGNGDNSSDLTLTTEEALSRSRDLIKTNKQGEAYALLSKLLEREPNNADAYMLRGIAYMREGRVYPAVADMMASVQIDPTATRYYNFGNVLHQGGYYKRAIRAYRFAMDINPQDVRVLNNMGSALIYDRRPQEAVTYLEQATQISPQDPEAYTNLGIAYERMKDYDEAERYLMKALEVQPSYYQAAFNLAKVYEAMGDDDLAADAYYQYLDLRPDAPDYRKIENRVGGPRDQF